MSIDLGAFYRTSSNTLATKYYDGKNTCVYLDNIYRVYYDTTNFFIQRANPATGTTDWLNVAEFTYNTTTQKSYFYMNNIEMLALIS